MMEFLDMLLKWIVAPTVALVSYMFLKQQSHETHIAVLQAQLALTKEAHDREFKEMRDSFKHVFTKLDNIEQALRS